MAKLKHTGVLKLAAVVIAVLMAHSGAFSESATLWYAVSTNNSNVFTSVSLYDTVSDPDAPLQIECPEDISTYTDINECTADISNSLSVNVTSGTLASFTWEMTGATQGSSRKTGINQIANYVFNEGTTTVTCTAKDKFKNNVTCSFTVVVSDNQVPKLVSAPENITVTASEGECGAQVSWTEPEVIDNCTPSNQILKTSSHVSGSFFPLGKTKVTYILDDGMATTQVSYSFTVAVTDKTSPVLVAAKNITVNCGEVLPRIYSNFNEFVNAGGTATDNCNLKTSSFTYISQTQNRQTCPYTVTRTYQVSDVYNNIGTVEHLIFVGESIVTQPEPQEVLNLKSGMADITLINSGNWSVAANWSTGTVPNLTDNVTIPNGLTVTVNAGAACNNITIQSGGTVNYSGANTLQVYGDWTNNGTYNGGTNGIVEFTGASNAIISGTTNFEELRITKGSLNTTLTINGTTTVTSGGSLTLTSGLITIPAGGSFTVNPSSGITIPKLAGFDVTGGALTTGNLTITNEGLIRISSGTAAFGTNSGNTVHTQIDGAFIVTGGTVEIAGRLQNTAAGTLSPPGVDSGISISGGTVTLSKVGNGLSNVGSLNVTANGNFRFTGGTIVFQNESTASTALDLGLIGGTGTKTTIGGTFQFGNISTPAGTVFNISSNVPLNNVTSFPNADLKLINDVTIGQWALNPSTTIDLNGNSLRLAASATATYNFPLDNGSGVSIPVSITFTSGSFAGGAYIELETIGSKLFENKSSVNYLNRYWTVTTSGITNPGYDVTATYADADIAGTESEIAMGSYGISLPWVKYADVNAASNTVSTTGITNTPFVFTGITSDPPTVSISATGSSICIGASTTLTANPVGDPTFTYFWTSTPAGFTASSQVTTVTPSVNTTYSVTVTDGNGFTANASQIITVNPLPEAPTAGNVTVCFDGISHNGSATVGAGETVVWYDAVTGGNVTGTPSGNAVGTYLAYAAAKITATGCESATRTLVTVIINALPTANITGTTPICTGTTSLLNSNAVAGSGSITSYQWNLNGTAIPGATNATYSANTTGNYTVTVVNSNSCSFTSPAFSLTVNLLPTPTAGSNSPLCAGQTLNLTATGGISYSWTGPNGFTSNLQNPSIVSVTVAAAGNYTVTVTDANGCSATASTPVTVNPIPAVTNAATASTCSGTSPNITLTASTSSNFAWTVGTITGSITGASAASGPTINQVLTNPGNSTAGTVQYIVTPTSTTGSCVGSPFTITVTVHPAPTVTSPGNQTYCNGSATTAIPLTGTPAGVVFDVTGGTSVGLADQSGVTTIPVFTAVAGSATITLIPRANGCTGSPINFFITVNASPTLTGASQAATVCAGSGATVNLTGLRPNSISTIAYSINDIAQTPVAGVAGNASGNGSFTTVVLTAANNGQTMQVTGIITTSLIPNCSQSFAQNLTLTVNSPPVFTSCPTPTISLNTVAGACTAVGTYTVTASGQPAPAYTYTFTGATTGSGSGTGSGSTFNSGTTNVKVTATNACGSVDCLFTVTVTDNVPPVITGCPANISVTTGAGRTSCDQVASWTVPTATDNCTPAGSLVWTPSHTPGSNFPVGTTTVTYTVRDAGNNPTTCSFTVTVTDNTPPTFNTPGAITVYTNASCIADITPASTGNPTSLFDNCTPAGSLAISSIDGATTPGACAGSYSFTRTWRVQDAAGNFSTGTQLITVADNTAPTFTYVPPTNAISCTDSKLPAFTGQATAADNCGGTVTITYTDVTVAGSCAGNSTITRTFRATDCSGNFSTATQSIIVTDNLKPVASVPNKTVPCPANIPPYYLDYAAFIADGGIATDNCGPVTVALWDEIANGLGGQPGYCPTSVTRVYRVTDLCGNYTDVTQTITVLETCGCSPCAGATFRLADFLGNPSGTMVFTDLGRGGNCCTSPVGSNCISFNVRLDDDAVGLEIRVDGAAPSSQDWRINCSPITISGSIVCIPGGAFNLFTYCKPGGNKNTFTFSSIPGVIAAEGINTRVECSGQITATGIVSGATWNSIFPGTPGQYNSYLSSTTIPNPIFSAPAGSPPDIKYEVCGNIGSTVCNASGRDCDIITINVKQKIALNLNINPGLICVNNPLTLVADISPASTYTYEWHTGRKGTASPILSNTNTLTLNAPVPLEWYWLRVTDVDANGVLCSSEDFEFEAKADSTGPSVFNPPSGNLTIECNAPNANTLIQNWLTSAVALDENGNPLPVTHNYTGINMACGTILPVTFTASDHCGNIGTATANIIITDTQVPTWATAAGALNRSVSCSDAPGLAAAQDLVPVASDLCDPTLLLSKTSGSFAVGACPNTGTYTNTWIARDDCNNVSAVYTQIISITDITPPVFTTQAQNLNVECDGAGNITALNNWLANHGGAVAADACGGAITWTNSAPVFSDLCGATGMATVTFTATDVCGNSRTTQANFIISDTQAPVVNCPPATSGTTNTNECFSTTVVLGTPTASDNCSAPGEITFANNAPAQYLAGITTVTWTATDACGNQSTCTQLVTVTDNNQPPTISCQGDLEEQIAANNCSKTGVNIIPPTITDNCPNPVLTWILTGATTGNGVGPIPASQPFNVGITLVRYTVTDAGLNTATCTFQVWIKNLAAPQFSATCPATPVLANSSATDCDAVVTVPAPLISNPCNEAFTVTNNSPYKTSDANASGTYPVGSTSFTWTITDASGNVTTCPQTVTVTDIPPTVTCPLPIVIPADLNQNYATGVVVPPPTFADNCPNPTLTWAMTGTTTGTGNAGPGTISIVPSPNTFNLGVTTITYTITDSNGNTASCSFTVTVQGVPLIQCPAAITDHTDDGFCTRDLDPGVPVLLPGSPPPSSWSWTMSGATSGSGGNAESVPSAVVPNPYTFNLGVTTITWTACNISGCETCTQTVTIEDKEPPTFTSAPITNCVDMLYSATYTFGTPAPNIYNRDNLIIYSNPDGYTFSAGNKTLDLINLADNCCVPENMIINWRIDFAPTPDPAGPVGAMLNNGFIMGPGQPSGYGSDMLFPGDGVTFQPVIHTITYTVKDCNDNTSAAKTENITITPRPEIIKMN